MKRSIRQSLMVLVVLGCLLFAPLAAVRAEDTISVTGETVHLTVSLQDRE